MSRPPLEFSPSPRFRPTRAKPHAPTAIEGRPAVPRYLSAPAKQRFRQICKELESRRSLTKGDGELLALYATTWERWRTAMDDVTVRGEIILSVSRGKNGEAIEREKKNPYLVVAQECEKSMRGYLADLGFSPASREKVKAVNRDETKVPLPVGSVGAALIEFDNRRTTDEKHTGDEPVDGAVSGRYPNVN